MEELGRINIDINEGGAGGAGAGAVADEPTVKRVRSAAQKLAEALERVGRVQQIQYNRQFGGIARQYDVTQGFLSFARSPSFGGAIDLIRPGSATGDAIAKLGKNAASVSSGLLAVGVAATALKFAFDLGVKAFRTFEQAMEAAMARIKDLSQLSGQLAMIEATRQTQELALRFEELNRNGAAYIRLASLNLVYEREKARTNMALNRINAELGMAFQRMMIGVYSLTNKAAEAAPKRWDLLLYAGLKMFPPLALGGIPRIIAYLMEIGLKAEIIANNTRPKIDFSKANEWAMQDIKAMTGRTY